MTVSQSGSGASLLRSLNYAYDANLTCFNIVNVVDSPITQEIDQIVLRQIEQSKKDKQDKNVQFDASDDSDSQLDMQVGNRNIGLYTKTGYCYSDIKSFLPQVVSLVLVAIWFSDNKQQHNTTDLD